MIWATVSSWSCFCWLFRASPSLVAKNIISLILVLTIWWCPCVESSLVYIYTHVHSSTSPKRWRPPKGMALTGMVSVICGETVLACVSTTLTLQSAPVVYCHVSYLVSLLPVTSVACRVMVVAPSCRNEHSQRAENHAWLPVNAAWSLLAVNWMLS